MIVIGDTAPSINDRGAYALACERANRLFKTVEMQKAAKFACTVNERVADYVEQAPVLAIAISCGGGKLNGGQGGARIYAAHKIGKLAERGARLKDVMTAYGLPLSLRKLKAKALSFQDEKAIRAIATLPLSALSQAIPNSIVAQRIWLSTVSEWLRLTERVSWETRWKAATTWVIVQTAKHGVRRQDVGAVGDFLMRGDVAFNQKWEWPRAAAASDDWHDRISAGDAKAKFGVMADQVIDRGPHPDFAEVNGYEFVALRTPTAIHAEGKSMHHCVASYVQDVMSGRFSIVAIRRDERRVATLELDCRAPFVRQLKGRFNATPPADVQTAARRYTFDLRKTAA